MPIMLHIFLYAKRSFNATLFCGGGVVSEMQSMSCPECAGAIAPKAELALGELLSCPDCGTRLEVTGIAPPEIGIAPAIEEDWGE